MKNKHAVLLITIVALVIGIYIGRLLASDNITTDYSCNQIARFHADRLIRDYEMRDGFNTDPENPKADFNQRASDINSMILSLCFLDPNYLSPHVKPIIEEILSGQWRDNE